MTVLEHSPIASSPNVMGGALVFTGTRVVDFSNSGGSGHSSVPIPLSIRVRSGRHGRRRVESGSRGTVFERRGEGHGQDAHATFWELA
ncbi:MAG: hypothetical protein NWQ35_05980, partial [Verrucomicrobiales bacterium]|nr:hypothetical protein [Verrucomicrobiales bacterium]